MIKKVNETKTAQAKLRSLRISPQKLNLVASSIRGLKVSKALSELQFSTKRISEQVKKLLLSAIANAENNHNMDVDKLVVSEAYVGRAMVMKRFAAAARGRGCRITKPFSNITIKVIEKELPVKQEKSSDKTKKVEKTEVKAKESKDSGAKTTKKEKK